ncbi:MAG: DUF935 domain-containing protein [Candidatus Gastranaerophilales bacterium]|nr:DUF935 domain-containing protein [Candidatus Gastranaerophilales bacterium]
MSSKKKSKKSKTNFIITRSVSGQGSSPLPFHTGSACRSVPSGCHPPALHTGSADKSIFDIWASTLTAEGFSSVIDRLPNPDIILKKAGKRIEVLRTLINHYQVGTCIDSRKSGVLSLDWALNDNEAQKNIVDFINEIFKTIDVYTFIEQILDAPLFGYCPIEISYEKNGNFIVPIGVMAKPQEWFYFNSLNEFFYKDRTMAGKRPIDFQNGYKFLLPRHKPDYLNPYGQAILSRCFWNVAFINGGMEFLVKFCEKFGMPYVFGKYDRSMTDIEKQQMLESLTQMVQDAAAVIPSDGTVEIVQTGSNGSSDIHLGLINKCEQNIAKAILGQTLTTDVGTSGSYAAANTHMGVRADIINSDKKLVESTINKFISIVCAINFGNSPAPKFAFIEDEDLNIQKAERDLKIYSLGVQFSKEYLSRTYGYKEEDIECVSRSVAQGTPFNYAEADNNVIDIALDDPKNPLNKALNTVIEGFNKTRNAEEALENLAEIYPDLSTEELEETLTKIIFISELKGRTDVRNNS